MILTEQQIRQIRDLYEELGNKTEVSRITGHSRSTVIRHTQEKNEDPKIEDPEFLRLLKEARSVGEPGIHRTGKIPDYVVGLENTLQCVDTRHAQDLKEKIAKAYAEKEKERHKTIHEGKWADTLSEPRRLPRKIGSRDTFQLPPYRKVAFVSCTHHPYQNKHAVDAVLNYISANNFDLIVLGGDQCDFYKISRFSKDPRRELKLQEEITETIKFVRNVNSLDKDVVWIDGNHDDRMRRHIAETGLSGIEALEIPNLFELPAHWAYAENQAHIRLGSLLMCHGDLAGAGSGTRHIAHSIYEKLATSVLFGHYHRFSRYYHTDYDRVQRAAFACGHLCDEPSADYVRSPGWQTGFCEVEYDHDSNLFSVRDHVITKGKFYANGRIWG